jgi:hypothetical protein
MVAKAPLIRQIAPHAGRIIISIIISAAIWFGARGFGDQYSRMTYNINMDRCSQRMAAVSTAVREYHRRHPEVPWSKVTTKEVRREMGLSDEMFLCPSVALPNGKPAGADGPICTYIWCIGNTEWEFVQKRRGDEMPLLVCVTHIRTKLSDGTVNVARLNGRMERIKLPLGVGTDEY